MKSGMSSENYNVQFFVPQYKNLSLRLFKTLIFTSQNSMSSDRDAS